MEGTAMNWDSKQNYEKNYTSELFLGKLNKRRKQAPVAPVHHTRSRWLATTCGLSGQRMPSN